MGVSGLLPFLKKCSRHVNINEFKGFTVAIDAYCWIHRASYSCAMDIALGNPTSQYVNYCLKYLNMILDAGIRPIMVFDGEDLPAKSDIDSKRRTAKKMYKEKAAQYLLEGNRKAANECFERCVEVTADMARAVIKGARDLGVDCIVAPYESDAQLAYLVQAGYADLVITEDSDLLMFGCKQVLFKLDLSGSALLIAWSAGIGELCCGISSHEFSPANLRFMGILSGCDYFPGIPQIGLATAAKVMRQCRTTDFRYLLSHLGDFCNLTESACQPIPFSQEQQFSKMRTKKGKSRVGICKLHGDTIRAAVRAERTFRLQVVFDPITRRRLRLSEPTVEDIEEEKLTLMDADMTNNELFTYAGRDSLDPQLAVNFAVGNIDFNTGTKVDTFDPDNFKVKKLFNIHSDKVQTVPTWSCSGTNSIKPVLKRISRPDGERLNASIWSKIYKLEPVWLCYVDAGTRSRPFCIAVEDKGNDSQIFNLKLKESANLHKMESGDKVSLISKMPVSKLENVEPDHNCSGETSTRAVESNPSTTRKRPLYDTAVSNLEIRDLLCSYTSDNDHVVSKEPHRTFSTCGTPITSANSYFASPVSEVLPITNLKGDSTSPTSPIFRSKRSRPVLSVVNSDLPRQHPRPVSSFLSNPFSVSARRTMILPPDVSADVKNLVFDGTSTEQSTNESMASVKRPFTLVKRSPLGQVQQNPATNPYTACNESEQPRSPVYDGQTVGFQWEDDQEHFENPTEVPATLLNRTKDSVSGKSGQRSAGPELISFFRKWHFSPSERRSKT